MDRRRIVLYLSPVLLASAILIVSAFSLTAPKQSPKHPTPTISKEEVLSIGIRYVEATYGTDYALNGDGVVDISYSNGTGNWAYPAASFRIPADWQQPGKLVNVMVNPETGEIFTVLTSWSQGMPP